MEPYVITLVRPTSPITLTPGMSGSFTVSLTDKIGSPVTDPLKILDGGNRKDYLTYQPKSIGPEGLLVVNYTALDPLPSGTCYLRFVFISPVVGNSLDVTFVAGSPPAPVNPQPSSGSTKPALIPDTNPSGQPGVITGGKAPVHDQADGASPVIGSATPGEAIWLQYWRGDWCYTLYDNATRAGWVRGKFIQTR